MTEIKHCHWLVKLTGKKYQLPLSLEKKSVNILKVRNSGFMGRNKKQVFHEDKFNSVIVWR